MIQSDSSWKDDYLTLLQCDKADRLAGYDTQNKRFVALDSLFRPDPAKKEKYIDTAMRLSEFMQKYGLQISQLDLFKIRRCYDNLLTVSKRLNPTEEVVQKLAEHSLLLNNLAQASSSAEQIREQYKLEKFLTTIPTLEDFKEAEDRIIISYKAHSEKITGYSGHQSQTKNMSIHFLDEKKNIITHPLENDSKNVQKWIEFAKAFALLRTPGFIPLPLSVKLVSKLPADKELLANLSTIYIGFNFEQGTFIQYNLFAPPCKISTFQSALASMTIDKLKMLFLSTLHHAFPNYEIGSSFDRGGATFQINVFNYINSDIGQLLPTYHINLYTKNLIADEEEKIEIPLACDIPVFFKSYLEKRRGELFNLFRKENITIKEFQSHLDQPLEGELKAAPFKIIICYTKCVLDNRGFFTVNYLHRGSVCSHDFKWGPNFEVFLKNLKQQLAIENAITAFNTKHTDVNFRFLDDPREINFDILKKGEWFVVKNSDGSFSVNFLNHNRKRKQIVKIIDSLKIDESLIEAYRMIKTVPLCQILNTKIQNEFEIYQHRPEHDKFAHFELIANINSNAAFSFDLIFIKNNELNSVCYQDNDINVIADKIIHHYRCEEKTIWDDLKRAFGDIVVEMPPVMLNSNQLVIHPKGRNITIYLLDDLGRMKTFSSTFFDIDNILTKARNYLKAVNWINEYRKKQGAIRFDFGEVCQVYPFSLQGDRNYELFWLLYIDRNTKKPIVIMDIKLEGLEGALKEAYADYREAENLIFERAYDKRFEPSVKTRAQTRTGTDVPPLLTEGKIELLMDYFIKLDVKKNRATLEDYLKNFIKVITEERPGYFGVPQKEDERKAFYSKLKAFLSQIIVKLADPQLEPLLREECVMAFALAGINCGARWAGETIQQYHALFGQGSKSVDDCIMGYIDRIKVGIIENMVNEGTQNTHEFIAMCKALIQKTGLGIPASAGADYNDPYAATALCGKYRTPEEIRAGFMDQFNAPEIVEVVHSQLNGEIKRTKGNFIYLLNETFKEIIVKQMAGDEGLQQIIAEYETAKNTILIAGVFKTENVKKLAAIDLAALKTAPLINGRGFQKLQQQLLITAYEELHFEWNYIDKNSQNVESDKAKELKRIQEEYAVSVRGLRDRLMEAISAKREKAVYHLTQRVLLEKEYYLLDENDLPRQLTRRGARELLLHYDYLTNKV